MESRSRQIERDSIVSMQTLSRIALDTDQVRVLVEDHIASNDPATMATIEMTLERVLQDLDRSSRDFARLVELPREAAEWDVAQTSLARFRATVEAALVLSRQNLDAQARGRLRASRSEYASLDPALIALIAINRQGALDAEQQIQTAEQTTRNVTDGIRFAAIVCVVLLGWWLSRKIMRYERELEESNRDLDAFAGRIAHDVKNAIGPILLSSDLSRRNATEPERVRHIADRTATSVQNVNHIVDSLLAFSRASQGVEADEAVAVRAVVDAVVEEVRSLALRLDATIAVAEIPDVTVRCNEGLLHIVLANVLGNAVKYLEGQPRKRVNVSASREDTFCRFDIADTGPGIPKHDQAAIFEPFYRGRSTQVPGTGIGLATVRRIVEARGGRITVESQEGHGARFTIWLPIADRAVSRPPAQQTPDIQPGMKIAS
jgi:signal transduction histidine kinase